MMLVFIRALLLPIFTTQAGATRAIPSLKRESA